MENKLIAEVDFKHNSFCLLSVFTYKCSWRSLCK